MRPPAAGRRRRIWGLCHASRLARHGPREWPHAAAATHALRLAPPAACCYPSFVVGLAFSLARAACAAPHAPPRPQGIASQGAQQFVGYKGSTVAGSAPKTRDGKAGFVYKLGQKNGKGNIDEYAPIYTPDQWKFDGDKYEPGLPGLAAWAVRAPSVASITHVC